MEQSDSEFLLRAINIAKKNILNGGGPFGAVIVENGEIIAESGNSVRIINDPTAHAEVQAIRKACAKRGTFSLEGTTIYASCEPCPMCLGAIYWAKISRLVFAGTRKDAAEVGFDDAKIYEEIILPFDERTINTKHLYLEASKDVFDLWKNTENKEEY